MIFKHHEDRGHGGTNFGTCALGVMAEKDWTLTFGDLFTKTLSGFDIGQSSSRDVDINLSQTERKAAFIADMTSSFHVNASKNKHAHGIEVYHRRNDWQSSEVAQAIVAASPAELRRPRNRMRVLEAWDDPNNPDDDWEVHPQTIVEVHESQICVLVEFGYATNSVDAEILLSGWGQRAMVAAVLAGVARAMVITNGR